MKTKIASLLKLMLAIIFSASISGCYTQLAFVDDDWDSTEYSSPSFSAEPIVILVPVITPIINPTPEPPPPAYDPPIAKSNPAPVETPKHEITRDSGYQRSGATSGSSSEGSNSDRRPTSTGRSGR